MDIDPLRQQRFYDSVEAGQDAIIYRGEIVNVCDNESGWTYLWRGYEFGTADDVMCEIDLWKAEKTPDSSKSE